MFGMGGCSLQPRRCRVTVLGKLFTPIVPLFTKQQNWWQPSYERVTACLAESNGNLSPDLWLTSPAGWLPRTGISSGTLCSAVKFGLPLPLHGTLRNRKWPDSWKNMVWSFTRFSIDCAVPRHAEEVCMLPDSLTVLHVFSDIVITINKSIEYYIFQPESYSITSGWSTDKSH